jgi:hypothetical protein
VTVTDCTLRPRRPVQLGRARSHARASADGLGEPGLAGRRVAGVAPEGLRRLLVGGDDDVQPAGASGA